MTLTPLAALTGLLSRPRAHGPAPGSPWALDGAIGWDASSGAYQDTDGVSPCVGGSDVALWRGQTAATPDARQATSGNRFVWVASSTGGRPGVRGDGSNKSLSLVTGVVLTGGFGVYAFGNRITSAQWQVGCRQAGGAVIEVYLDDAVYLGVDGGGYVQCPYTGTAGGVAFCWRRSASDAVTFTATGQAETAMGTRAGTLTLDMLLRQDPYGSVYGDACALVVLPSEVSPGDHATVAAWGLSRFGTALP